MTKLLDEAIAKVRELSESDQDVAAQFLLAFANPDAPRYQLTEEQAADVKRAQQEVRESKIATEDEMADAWRRFGL